MPRLFVLLVAPLLLAGFAPGMVDVTGTVQSGGRFVSEAIVWLDAEKGAPAEPRPKAVLDQRNVNFSPQVLAVQVGTKVEFPNHDRVFHNVFSDHEGKKFNLGLYPVGMVKEIPFDQPGLSRIFCNIHPQMSAYVMVVDTPYFAVADQSGRFNIHGVPPGAYRYHAWRPGADMLNGDMVAESGISLDIRW